VYAADDPGTAWPSATACRRAAAFVTPPGHIVTASSVRFYAADAEQDGVLARQHEIDNIGKQLRAQALLADEARTRATRADAAATELQRRLQDGRQKVATLQREVHALQIDVVKQAEVEARFNQRSGQIGADLDEIAAQEAEQRQARPRPRPSSRSSTWSWPSCRARTKTARPSSWKRNAR
jgi:chromosome segregation protein